MVELLQSPAWAIKVDDIARAKVKSNREMRNFRVPPDFSWKARWPTQVSRCMLRPDAAGHNGERL